MTAKAVPERLVWAVETLAPDPDAHLLEIGCGPGAAVLLICERLVGGRIVAIDRSATAISRAERRNAEHVATGRAVFRTLALEELEPSDVIQGQERFDKIFAMNVNLFWVRHPRRELDLLKSLLRPGGALYLFYGYGTAPMPGERAAGLGGVLTRHLTEHGFSVEFRKGPSVVCAVARVARSNL